MADPTTLEEYNKKFERETKVEGFGRTTRMIIPCIFCAEPGLMTYRVISMEKDMAGKDFTCASCHRTAVMLFDHPNEQSTSIRLAQTGGDDPPEYMRGMLVDARETKG